MVQRNRSSQSKRERDQKKRERQRIKAEKDVLKRERRLGTADDEPADTADPLVESTDLPAEKPAEPERLNT
jgi:hypothetical protein